MQENCPAACKYCTPDEPSTPAPEPSTPKPADKRKFAVVLHIMKSENAQAEDANCDISLNGGQDVVLFKNKNCVKGGDCGNQNVEIEIGKDVVPNVLALKCDSPKEDALYPQLVTVDDDAGNRYIGQIRRVFDSQATCNTHWSGFKPCIVPGEAVSVVL